VLRSFDGPRRLCDVEEGRIRNPVAVSVFNKRELEGNSKMLVNRGQPSETQGLFCKCFPREEEHTVMIEGLLGTLGVKSPYRECMVRAPPSSELGSSFQCCSVG
jgi:hypothetical protein